MKRFVPSRSRVLWTSGLTAGLLSAIWLLFGAPASSDSPPPVSELGSPAQQEAVRTGRETAFLPERASCTVDPARELFITDLSVVNDCIRASWSSRCLRPPLGATPGAWTVGGLLPGIFGTNDPELLSKMTLKWLKEWKSDKTVNGDLVPARPNIESLVIDPWRTASGGPILDMTKAPFRLLAIVTRLDLRQNAGYSAGTSAGEARFVFNLLDASGNPTQFLLIFEYGLEARGCSDVLSWANRFHHLGTIPFGNGYNSALQAITDSFTAIGAAPGKPNGSAINQVRTNDFFLATPWELREFQLASTSLISHSAIVPLAMATVAQTAANSHQETANLASYVNTDTPALLSNTHVVPLSFGGNPFRGGASRHSLEFGWDGPRPACTSIANADARHLYSLNTCNGCHGGETDTFFKHVEPRAANAASTLSAFLTGGSSVDLCGIPRNFGDIERRRVDLCQLLEKSCSQIDAEPRIAFVH